MASNEPTKIGKYDVVDVIGRGGMGVVYEATDPFLSRRGFGPRFLRSTGQAYKGGPNSGVFLQITCDDAKDLPVPGQKYTFGIVKAAQARGDFQVLAERNPRALRVHLGADVKADRAKLNSIISRVLA